MVSHAVVPWAIEPRHLGSFDALVGELICGGPKWSSFQPWEMQLLLDLSTCRISRSRRTQVLLQYQQYVRKEIRKGRSASLLSVFLEKTRKTKKSIATNDFSQEAQALLVA